MHNSSDSIAIGWLLLITFILYEIWIPLSVLFVLFLTISFIQNRIKIKKASKKLITVQQTQSNNGSYWNRVKEYDDESILDKDYYNNYDDNGILIEPDWEYDELSFEEIEDIMDLEYFEENILKRKVCHIGRYNRNANGNARLKTTFVRAWLCDDCFPIISKDEDPELYAEKVAEIKNTQKIVQMAKNQPDCTRSKWYLRHDGEIAVNNFGIQFRISYKEEMETILYFIHRIDYDE